MKTLILFLLLAVPCFLFSQPLAEGPAKIYIKQYISYIEKAKAPGTKPTMVKNYLQQAEGAIRSIVKYDPSFNVKPLEEELNQLKEQNTIALNKGQEEKIIASIKETIEEMDKIPEEYKMTNYPGRIANIESGIKSLKKINPGYNTVEFEEAVKEYSAIVERKKKERDDRLDALSSSNDKNGDGLAGLFMGDRGVQWIGTGNFESDLKEHIEYVKTFNEKVDRLIASNPDISTSLENYIRNAAEGEKGKLMRFMKGAVTDRKEAVVYNYREIVGLEAYWKAAKRVFTRVAEAAAMHKMISDSLTSLGSMDEVITRAAKKREERLKNTFVPKPLLSNAVIEAEFREAFANEGWGETLLKVSLQSRDWDIVRNNLTGAIICRTQSAYIAAKQKAGNCILYSFTIKQQFNGSSYSSVSSRYSHGVIENEFLCENVNK